MYSYGRSMLMYGRNQHNIVKQLSFTKVKKKKSLFETTQAVTAR